MTNYAVRVRTSEGWQDLALTGPQGPAGPEGPASTVPGPAGPEGPVGPAGTGINMKGQVANPGALPPTGNVPGDAYTAASDGNLYVWDGDSWNNVGPMQGPAGATGATGPQGPAGATGPQGPKGDTGATGTAGTPGATGAQGIQGPKGDTGAQGIPGTTGAQGTAGATGAQGPKGDTGATGADGPQGIQGVQGVQGPKGDPQIPNDTAPVMSGVASAGALTTYSRGDHKHPSDTTRVAKTGDTMSGHLTIPTGPADANAVRKDYVDPLINTAYNLAVTKVAKAGDTMTGPLVLSADPTTALHAATKQYVDNNTITQAAADTRYVNVSGDTMTGALAVQGTFTGSVGVVAGAGGTTGTYYFGNTATKSLAYDGTKFVFTGGDVSVPVLSSVGAIYSGASAAKTGTYYFGSDTTKAFRCDGTNFDLYGGSLNIGGASVWIASTMLGVEHPTSGNWPAAAKGNDRGIIYLVTATVGNIYAYFTQGTTANAVGTITGTTTTTAYNTTSSGELKEDLKSFDAGSIIDETKVYDFAWKSTGDRSYGVIAQQAVDVYPLAVTHMQMPEAEGGDYWGVDYSKYVPVLLQELKALRARVAALEGGTAAKPS